MSSPPIENVTTFNGKWHVFGVNECEVDTYTDNQGVEISEAFKAIVEFNGNSVSLTESQYPNGTCSGTPVVTDITYRIEYLEGELETTVCNNAQKVNFLPESVTSGGMSLTQAEIDQAIADKDLAGPAPYNSLCTDDSGSKLFLADNESDGGYTEDTRLTTLSNEFFLVKE